MLLAIGVDGSQVSEESEVREEAQQEERRNCHWGRVKWHFLTEPLGFFFKLGFFLFYFVFNGWLCLKSTFSSIIKFVFRECSALIAIIFLVSAEDPWIIYLSVKWMLRCFVFLSHCKLPMAMLMWELNVWLSCFLMLQRKGS